MSHLQMNGFESETFAVKDWFNAVCRSKPTDQPLEKYIGQLEMQLQLKCEEVEEEVESTASKVAQQMPFVIQEAEKIKSEMTALNGTLRSTVSGLKERSTQAKDVVSGINKLHRVKSNMQSACESLKEATELSELFIRVDAVFSSGDIFAMANIMSTMHRSLKLVGNVPEFQSGKEKLKTLEENLVSSIEAKLTSAILEKQDEHVKKLCEILITLDRYASLEKIYVAAKRQEMKSSLKAASEQLARRPDAAGESRAEDAVREWHDALLRKTNDELEWCCTVFPDHSPRLLSVSFESSLQEWNVFLEAVLKRDASVPFTILVQQATLEFCLTLRQLLESVIGEEAMLSIVECAFLPTEKEVSRFASLEGQILTSTFDPRTTHFVSPTEIESSMETIFQLMDRALEHCVSLTGGTELDGLSAEIEACLGKYIAVLTSSLKGIRASVLPAPVDDEGSTTTVLHLIKIGRALEKYLNRFQSKLIQTMAEVRNQINKSSSTFDLVHIRLRKSPNRALRLQAFLENQEWNGHFSVKQAIDGFSAASEALVFDVLMHKPRALFTGFSEMAEWSKEETPSAISSSLPQFSAYPLHYVSAFGEYLMLVPQQLEALVSTEAETDDHVLDQEEEMASALLTKVIVGSSELYADEILCLSSLSSAGSLQLVCDVQYFSNVLSAMGSHFPQPLASVYEAIQSPLEKLKQLIDEQPPESNSRLIYSTILKIRTSSVNP